MKLTKLFDNDENRAVSPVIGVILMVAITVILAAVIGTFVLGLGDQVQTSPRAGVSFDQGSGGSPEVTVTWVSQGNIGSENDLTISGGGFSGSGQLGEVGDTASATCSDGDTITVTGATSEGTKGVVGTYTVK